MGKRHLLLQKKSGGRTRYQHPCSSDVTTQCMMGNITFQSFLKTSYGYLHPRSSWPEDCSCTRNVCINNRGSWAAPMAAPENLDTCPCKHLLTITGHRWPGSLSSNKTLYKMRNTKPLSVKSSPTKMVQSCATDAKTHPV